MRKISLPEQKVELNIFLEIMGNHEQTVHAVNDYKKFDQFFS